MKYEEPISKLYYDLYVAQIRKDWKTADKIQRRLRELEEREKRIDVA